MVIFFLFYILIYLVIWWGYFGYAMFLYIASKLVSQPKLVYEIKDYPSVTILVPCFNEEELVSSKVENLSNLNYPREKMRIIFLEGNSTDKTAIKLKEEINEFDFMEIVETHCRGKINQINFILPKIKSDIIVNADMDAQLDTELLIKLVSEFQTYEKVGVVGAYVIPRNCLNEERLYWKNQNRLRLLESKVQSSSIVIAVCYAFRRGIIDSFPGDVIADDIYLPFEANLKGYKIIYSADAIAYEMRSPKSLGKMFRHKFRKSNAYLAEILRFLYKLPFMKFTWKVIYLTKVLQFLVMPWFLIIFLLMSAQFLFNGEQGLIQVLFFFSLVSLLLTHFIFACTKSKAEEIKGGLFLTPKVFLISILILWITGLSYPFFRQSSSYQKI